MNALSLFSGIGGIDLAAEWAGIEVVAFCEQNPYCQEVIRKHWPNIPIYDDVCTLTRARLEADGIDCDAIGLIFGGYPCQPFSLAGNREGEEDDRHLWPEVFRLLQEIQPKWFVGENVAGHVTLGLDIVLSDLESIGNSWESFVIPACAVNAPHRRDRVFIASYADSIRNKAEEKLRIERERTQKMQERFESQFGLADYVKTFRNADSIAELQADTETSPIGNEWEPRDMPTWKHRGDIPGNYWNENQPPVCGVDDGIPGGLDESRLIALGNAVVPQQIYPILAAIKQIDDLINAA